MLWWQREIRRAALVAGFEAGAPSHGVVRGWRGHKRVCGDESRAVIGAKSGSAPQQVDTSGTRPHYFVSNFLDTFLRQEHSTAPARGSGAGTDREKRTVPDSTASRPRPVQTVEVAGEIVASFFLSAPLRWLCFLIQGRNLAGHVPESAGRFRLVTGKTPRPCEWGGD